MPDLTFPFFAAILSIFFICALLFHQLHVSPWNNPLIMRRSSQKKISSVLDKLSSALFKISIWLSDKNDHLSEDIHILLWKIAGDLNVDKLMCTILYEKEDKKKITALKKIIATSTPKAMSVLKSISKNDSLAKSITQLADENLSSNTLESNHRPSHSIYVASAQEVYMGNNGDSYDVSGQAGAVGPNSIATGNTFNQIWEQSKDEIDLDKLAVELAELRQKMKAAPSDDPEHAASAGSIASAEIAALKNDGPKTIENLKAAGQWALKFAEGVGAKVAEAALKKALGL
jgi:hypothetical protein